MPEGVVLDRFDDDTFKNEVEEAKQQGGQFFYGKLDIKAHYAQFIQSENKDWTREDLTLAQYKKKKAAKERGLMMEMVWEVDAGDFNPNQPFIYNRKFRIGGFRSKNPDWFKTIYPAIIEAIGDANKLKPGLWVEVEDVEQFDNPKYNVPALRRVFGSMQECAKAWAERYASAQDTSSDSSNGPIPADIIASAKKMFNALGNNAVAFRTVLADDDKYSRYNADELIAAVSA